MSSDITDTQLQTLTQRWADDPTPHLALQLADVYRHRDELEKALPILERELELHPEHVSIQVAVGRYRLEAGDSAGAAEVLRTVVDKDPGHLVANKSLVLAHLALGDRKSAADRLDLYALLNDGDPELEELRASVGGEQQVAERPGPPPLPEAFGAEPPTAAVDLTSLTQPSPRSVTGALDRDPFAELGMDPLRPEALPAFLQQEAVEEPEVLAETPAASAEPTPETESAPELGDEVEEESALEEPLGEAEEDGEQAASDRTSPAELETGAGATATLGALYLAQGHLADARRTFEQVLERDPEDAEAKAGMEEIERHSRADQAVAEPPDARIARLERYLSRIRAAAERLSA